mgnify:CR=1 FL=1
MNPSYAYPRGPDYPRLYALLHAVTSWHDASTAPGVPDGVTYACGINGVHIYACRPARGPRNPGEEYCIYLRGREDMEPALIAHCDAADSGCRTVAYWPQHLWNHAQRMAERARNTDKTNALILRALGEDQ